MFSDIPAAIGPFLLTLTLKPDYVGGNTCILCGIGDLLIILTIVLCVLPN
jgi:hypothetical protein